ncbi:MAG TPA: hypothetical protein VNZ57_02105 [Longimicrobiales bacterium]|nr:hypothetical protein [Longimicrobiales bacterium]
MADLRIEPPRDPGDGGVRRPEIETPRIPREAEPAPERREGRPPSPPPGVEPPDPNRWEPPAEEPPRREESE